MKSRIPYLLLLLAFLSAVLCESPPSFCKCTCFSNSTIIPLSSTSPSDNTDTSSGSTASSSLFHTFLSRAPTSSKPKKERTCADCNRQFCLDYNLPICKDVKLETDVFATCFQRDSFKDEVVVFLFIGATVGLMGWAFLGPFIEGWVEKIKGRHTYNPVSGG